MSKKTKAATGVAGTAELLPMGAVTRRTGISEHTLRAWERRFDFPRPTRLASGHRRYTEQQVSQLILISRALEAGCRAGDVVPLSATRLHSLFSNLQADETQSAGFSSEAWVNRILAAAIELNSAAIDTAIVVEAAELGVSRFLRERAVPLIAALGEGWANGEIEVRHEHLVTQVLESRLRALRAPFDNINRGRPIVLACLPGEVHGLGLQLAGVESAASGRKVLILGPQTPVAEIAAAARTTEAVAVGLSVSLFAAPDETLRMVNRLRTALSPDIELWVGGGGAAALSEISGQVEHFHSLDDLRAALQTLPA